jgi:hypothetical protein
MGAVGGIAILAIVFWCCWWIRKRSKRNTITETQDLRDNLANFNCEEVRNFQNNGDPFAEFGGEIAIISNTTVGIRFTDDGGLYRTSCIGQEQRSRGFSCTAWYDYGNAVEQCSCFCGTCDVLRVSSHCKGGYLRASCVISTRKVVAPVFRTL